MILSSPKDLLENKISLPTPCACTSFFDNDGNTAIMLRELIVCYL